MSYNQQEYTDEGFCDNCDKRQPIFFRTDGHERDSSGDYQECLVCHFYNFGSSSRWYPPYEDK